jgi:hypothetical protein
MRVTRTASAAFLAEFESEAELREEHRLNLAIGALRLPTPESAALHSVLLVTLRGPWGGESFAKATVVALLPGALALMVEGNPDEHLERLLAKRPDETAPEPEPATSEPPAESGEGDTAEKRESAWNRMRSLSQMEKLMLAPKADRAERALLLQDNDPRVLLSLLRNPRITVDEIVRIAKSSFINFQIVDVIMKTGQWMSNLDVRTGLIHNPKTPQAFALRILPTLPDSEVRNIARSGTNMALKQAALRKIQGMT